MTILANMSGTPIYTNGQVQYVNFHRVCTGDVNGLHKGREYIQTVGKRMLTLRALHCAALARHLLLRLLYASILVISLLFSLDRRFCIPLSPCCCVHRLEVRAAMWWRSASGWGGARSTDPLFFQKILNLLAVRLLPYV